MIQREYTGRNTLEILRFSNDTKGIERNQSIEINHYSLKV